MLPASNFIILVFSQIYTWRYILRLTKNDFLSSSQYIQEYIKLNKFLIEINLPAWKQN